MDSWTHGCGLERGKNGISISWRGFWSLLFNLGWVALVRSTPWAHMEISVSLNAVKVIETWYRGIAMLAAQ